MTACPIHHRLTRAVIFTADLGPELDNAPDSVRLGAAVKAAIKAGADLTDADLTDADLTGANLTGANLTRADLTRADLRDANLYGANLTRADFYGAIAIIDAGTPNGWRAVGWHRDDKIRVIVGCRNFSLTEGREYWAKKPHRREVLAALNYIETVARLREWPEAAKAEGR